MAGKGKKKPKKEKKPKKAKKVEEKVDETAEKASKLKEQQEEEERRQKMWLECWDRKIREEERMKDCRACCVPDDFFRKPRVQTNIWIRVNQEKNNQQVRMAFKDVPVHKPKPPPLPKLKIIDAAPLVKEKKSDSKPITVKKEKTKKNKTKKKKK